jgi:hypothetical protein
MPKNDGGVTPTLRSDCGIASPQLALPEAVADDGVGSATRPVVARLQQAAPRGHDTERVERVAAHPRAAHQVPRVALAHLHVEPRRPGEDAREGLLVVSDLLPERIRERIPPAVDAEAAVAPGNLDRDQRPGRLDRQGSQPHCIEELENRRVGADAERQRQDGDRRESRAPSNLPHAVPQIPGHPVERRPAPRFAALLLKPRDVAEPSRARLRPVERHLLLELGVELAPP